MELEANEFQNLLTLPMAVITTKDAKGVDNAAPYGCVMPVLKPFKVIALASALPRHTLANIRDTEEFIINIMGKPGFKESMSCAKDYPEEVSELEEVGLETVAAKKVKVPRIKKAIGWIEASLKEEILREDFSIVLGEVLKAEINEEYLESDQLTEDPLTMLNGEFRALGDSVSME
ncbi:flavin reductase family protein [Fuchsiella alkaliacetigena]|uniref:flavin reductase family protein n=1 Tax=Fuchsiella alkaliacetigena TaxID=957042 RepID=UPI002009F990|nr:flavin reductase family protein [Fuchsiella alkaliacetigena]MCK8826034.1 flavin reductase family protein [Fuchsiella alkaliacetigena]